MLASIRGRIALATLLLALPVAGGLVRLLGQDLDPFSLVDDVIFSWCTVGLCGGAAVALATTRWWGRFLPLPIAGVAILRVLGSGAGGLTHADGWLLLLPSLVLFLCVSGRAMFERFEARAPLPMSWTAPPWMSSDGR